MEQVKLLLEYGADLHARGKIDRTALWSAECAGHSEVVKLLLERGAELNSN
jgi:ankyrin repeat protein